MYPRTKAHAFGMKCPTLSSI